MWYSRGYNDVFVKLGYDPSKLQQYNPGPDAQATAGLGAGGAIAGGAVGAGLGLRSAGKRMLRSPLAARKGFDTSKMPKRWIRAAGKMTGRRVGRAGLLGAGLGLLAGTGLGLATTKHTDQYGK